MGAAIIKGSAAHFQENYPASFLTKLFTGAGKSYQTCAIQST
jgi:hypothetical protein